MLANRKTETFRKMFKILKVKNTTKRRKLITKNYLKEDS